jgi:hypothetical protein
MKTCMHSNGTSDRNRWGDLTESIRRKAPGAKIRLRDEFAPGLELILRRQVPPAELSAVIDRILSDVMLAIECDGLSSPDFLSALVRSTARRLIPTSTARIEAEVNARPNEVIECILQELPDHQREALRMVYVEDADDQTVCARTKLTLNELTALKNSMRERFVVTAVGQHSRAMSQ